MIEDRRCDPIALVRLALPLLLPLAFMVMVVPSGFLLESPGPAFDLQADLEVEGAETFKPEGELLLTSVSIQESNLIDCALSLFDGGLDVIRVRDYLGDELDTEVQDIVDTAITFVSQDTATVAGLREVGVPVEVWGMGALVVAVAGGYPAQGLVRAGEVIVAVNGEPVTDGGSLNSLINAAPEGENVALTLRALDGQRVKEAAQAPTDGSEKRPDLASLLQEEERVVEMVPVYEPALERRVIGVSIRDYFTYSTGVRVNWDLETVRGPSAGLMMTLSLVNALTPLDLTAGKKVAGTGEITLDGGVGPIGGLPMKIRAAESEGAEVFIYPLGNQDDLAGISTDMELHGVSTLREAVEYLRSLASR
ncbi:MAG: PDZ domain-containing protein [Actinobacteria bacterium]|nr:PDZ domain-containing protein [Actinomycetota bacterium]MDI6830990.1 PDZ domain-containing protein [Actinomycetota bacterium]